MSSTALRLRSRSVRILLSVIFAAIGINSAIAQDRTSLRSDPLMLDQLERMRIDNVGTVHRSALDVARNKISPELIAAGGRTQVVIRLSSPAAGELDNALAGGALTQKVNVLDEQAGFIARCGAMAPNMKVLARTQLVLNAVFVEVDAALLPELARDPAVSRIAPIGRYELDLTETVPYIGGSAVQAAGKTGDGINVAVLDSGIDYTHADLGGPGTLDAYNAAYADNAARDGLFPTANVVDGFDFVGEVWPNGDLAPDDDPIDFEGHGTHVADIIAGANGVAPGANLYAVKVCSAVSSSCSGIALIQGMEFAVDPNGDGDPSDGVDIINMSLGATFGQPFDDDLALAVDNATALGVLTVSSAGNCGDLPYCTGTPSSAPTALSVAQTQVPSAKAFLMNVVEPAAAAGLYNAVKYAWTPDPAALTEGIVQYGDTDGDNLDGCAPYDGDFTGQIVLADRGACFFSDKIRNIENAGGVLGIVGLVAPGAPFSGGFGGGDPINIPGFNISQADADILRAGGALVQFGPTLSESLVMTTVGSTARGPEMSANTIKPEIGAPGASVSAEVGTGTERTPFGGTSGASPMVAGAAALLLEGCEHIIISTHPKFGNNGLDPCSPLAIKARLMNNGDRSITSDTNGQLAEITRIGGGEVRVDWADTTPIVAYSATDDQPSLSLGLVDADRETTIHRRVAVTNVSDRGVQLRIRNEFRDVEDKKSKAVQVKAPSSLWVGAGRTRTFSVYFKINPRKLGGNPLNSHSEATNPAALTALEVDGYLTIQDRWRKKIALPWHVMPRAASRVVPNKTRIKGGGFPETIRLRNRGAGVAQNGVLTLIGLSDEMPRGAKGAQSPTPDLKAVGVTTVLVPPEFCAAEFLMVFGINTWDRQTHLLPVIHQVLMDIDQDGVFDYEVINAPLSILTAGDFSDVREVTGVFNLATGAGSIFFFAEHPTNSGNTTLVACGEQMGLSPADLLATNIDVQVNALDFYYGGPGDSIGDITITPFGEGLVPVVSGDLARGESGTIEVFDFGLFPGNSPEFGVTLSTVLDRGPGARGGATQNSESQQFLLKEVQNKPKPLDSGKK